MANKIILVIKREYLARVKKRSFIVATILTPLIFPTVLGAFMWIGLKDTREDHSKYIEVVDEGNQLFLESDETFVFFYGQHSLEEAKELVYKGNRHGVLFIPRQGPNQAAQATFFSDETPSLSLVNGLESTIKNKMDENRLYESGIDPAFLAKLKTSVSVTAVRLEQWGGEQVSNTVVNYAIGFIAGILIYTFIFVYGNQIMQGVIEEKSSRIIEILVSSLKPFQLMLGKIIGIGAVGLTQFMIWIVLIGVVTSLVMGYFGMQMPQQQFVEMANPDALGWTSENNDVLDILSLIQGVNFFQLVACFLIYFIGGYLLYGAFFAAVGAAVDSPSDAQQFMFPVTIPLLIAYMGLFIFVLDDPNSNISYWLSIIPFTSPVAMMGRVSFGVPFGQLALSVFLLIAGFLFTTWVAGKVYRIGILVHGSKVNYKILWKWIKEN